MQGSDFTTSADVYSFGIVLWEILSRELPFDEYEVAHTGFTSDLEEAIIEGLRPNTSKRLTELFDKESTENQFVHSYIDLLEECWQANPQDRPSFEKITQIAYEVSGIDEEES